MRVLSVNEETEERETRSKVYRQWPTVPATGPQWAWRPKPDDVHLYHKTGFFSVVLTLYEEPPTRSGFRRKVRVGWWDTSNWMTEIGFSVPRVSPSILPRLSKETKLSLGRWLTGVIF